MDSIAMLVIGAVLSIASLITAILTLTINKNKQDKDNDVKVQETEQKQALMQKELEVKYSRIETDLAEIKAMLTCSNEKYIALERRVFILENSTEKRTNRKKEI